MAEHVDVLIVGGGGVGHAMALQLGRAGISTLLVERRGGRSTHPKALGAHQRSMELYREWGLADEMTAAALPPEQALGFGWMTRVNGIELGRVMLVDDIDKLDDYSVCTRERMTFIAQVKLEEILARAVGRQDTVQIRFGTEAVAIEQDDAEATVTLREAEGGGTYQVRATYVVAADGVRSPLRRMLAITETADPPYGESVNVYLRSPGMDALRAGRPYVLWWTVNADSYGTFWPVGFDQRWIYNFEGDISQPDELFRAQRSAPTGSGARPAPPTSTSRFSTSCGGATSGRSPTSGGADGCSWPATPPTGSRRTAASASTAASRTPPTWPGSSSRCCAARRATRSSTATRPSASRSPSSTPSRSPSIRSGCGRPDGCRIGSTWPRSSARRARSSARPSPTPCRASASSSTPWASSSG